MRTRTTTSSNAGSRPVTRTAAALRIGALSLGLLACSLLHPLVVAAQGSSTRSAAAEEAKAAAVTLTESAAISIVPLLLKSNHLGRDAMNRYPGWIDWRNPRQAEIQLHVNEDGSVESVSLPQSSGHPLVDRALLEVAREMRFAPATLDGEAVAAWVRLPVKMQRES